MSDKVYVFYYNDMIEESSYAAVSLHRTKAGAYRAMRKFIVEECIKHNTHFRRHGNYGRWERWYVGERKIEE